MDAFNKRRRPQRNNRFTLNKVVEHQCRWRKYGWIVLVSLASLVFLFTLVVFSASAVFENANRLGRQCGLRARNPDDVSWGFSFAIVTCSDGHKTVRKRSFKQLLDLVSPNKKSYAEKHGYTFIDASDAVDSGRPPNWSKIKAIQKHLGSFDWIFWNDADTLITNSSITLESILLACFGNIPFELMPDMVITEDVTGINTGIFFMRNTSWTRNLLEVWWNQTTFVRPFGNTISGDNDALKYLVSIMPPEERELHIHIPKMQCLFNSYLWTFRLPNVVRIFSRARSVWRGTYSKGDFVLHFAGIDKKKIRILRALDELE